MMTKSSELSGEWVNDIHSRLNRTRVARVEQPDSLAAIRDALARARQSGTGLSLCGGRHAMGGQQFGSGTTLLDLSNFARIRHLDAERGLVTVDAGIRWPELIAGLHGRQRGAERVWSIRQKQTGADGLSVGGALAANIHGRGLRMAPIVGDVEAFTLVDARGEVRTCSRTEHPELFALAIGGYGAFGVIADVTLRLSPRQRLERRVELVDAPGLMTAFEERIAGGYAFGDWQFNIDETSDDFLRLGVFSCYRPLEANDARTVPPGQRELAPDDWQRLLELAHTDRALAFAEYARYYLATDGQLYWSDLHQLGTYREDYHVGVDRVSGAVHAGSESIAELYVPRIALADFLTAAAGLLRARAATLIYGTVRLIQAETETFLSWAREPWACVVMNLHVEHTPAGVAAVGETFHALYDVALGMGGSFYLTYGRHADRDQTLAAYPQFTGFLRQQRKRDPDQLWQSDWLRGHLELFQG